MSCITPRVGFGCSAREMKAEDRARRMAQSQRGHLTVRQVLSCGMSDRQIQHRRAVGGWVVVLPDVYRLPGVPDTFDGFLMAVQLWMGDDGFFIGSTAAYLYSLDGMEKPARVQVARYSGVGHPSLKVKRISRDDVPKLRWIAQLRTCSMERILLDVAAELPPKVAGRALDDALRRRLTTLGRVKRFLDEECGRGRRGSKTLRRLIAGRDDRDAQVRSAFEAQMLRILRRIKGFKSEANRLVVVGGERYFLDFFIPAALLGIECHSFRWHIGKHNEDARRDRRIRSSGIELLYFTWDDVFFDERHVEHEIRDAIGRRLGQLFRPDALTG